MKYLRTEDAHPVPTPMEISYLKQEDDTKELLANNRYCKALGNASTLTRPDINPAVGLLRRKTASPTKTSKTPKLKLQC